MKPSDDPKADQLINSNISQPNEVVEKLLILNENDEKGEENQKWRSMILVVGLQRNNFKCADGRTIMKDALSITMVQKVPPCFGTISITILMKFLAMSCFTIRMKVCYGYGTLMILNSGQTAKLLVQHGDVNALSIYAISLSMACLM